MSGKSRRTHSPNKSEWRRRIFGPLATAKGLSLACVDQHDKAYAWAERRRIEAHPQTGAIQIVELHEAVEEISPAPALAFDDQQAPQTGALLFDGLSEYDLLRVGVPSDWIADGYDSSLRVY